MSLSLSCKISSDPGGLNMALVVSVAIIGLLQVIGKFSIRIVPNQTPELVEKVTLAHLSKKWSERKTPNKLKMWCDGDRGWIGDTNNDNFQAGIRFVVQPGVSFLSCHCGTVGHPSSSSSSSSSLFCLSGSLSCG